MDIHISGTYDELSQKARDLIIDLISKKKDALICASTGNSPTKMYELLSDEYRKRPELFSLVHIIKLDEWGNLPMDHPKTCESYLLKHLIDPMQIDESRYISFLSNSQDPQMECIRIQQKLALYGPIDLCILGLGMNGHIDLNEPAQHLEPHCHVASLSDMSLKHPMAIGMGKNQPMD